MFQKWQRFQLGKYNLNFYFAEQMFHPKFPSKKNSY